MLYYLESSIQDENNQISFELTIHGCKYCFFPTREKKTLIFNTRITEEMSFAEKKLIEFIGRIALKVNSAHYGPQAHSRYEIIDTEYREDIFDILTEIEQFLFESRPYQEELTDSLSSENVLGSDSDDTNSSASEIERASTSESARVAQEHDEVLMEKIRAWRGRINGLLPVRRLDTQTERILMLSGYYGRERQTGPRRAGPYL